MNVHPQSEAFAALGLGAVALRYQQLGYAILGCRPGTKIPHQAYGPEGRGVLWADHDPRHVQWLWSQDRYASVAIATGARSRLMVVDLDVKGTARGDLSWEAKWGGWPRAFDGYPVVATPSGGWHLYMRLPDGWDVPNRPGILPGVDIKGANGYVLAPPAALAMAAEDGQHMVPYRWSTGCPCTVELAPEWLMEWAVYATATGSPGNTSNGSEAVELDQLRRDGLTPGSRNNELHRLSCSLFRRYGTTIAGVQAVRADLAAVLDATMRNGNGAGFGRGEIERAIESARRFVEQQQKWEAALVADLPAYLKGRP